METVPIVNPVENFGSNFASQAIATPKSSTGVNPTRYEEINSSWLPTPSLCAAAVPAGTSKIYIARDWLV